MVSSDGPEATSHYDVPDENFIRKMLLLKGRVIWHSPWVLWIPWILWILWIPRVPWILRIPWILWVPSRRWLLIFICFWVQNPRNSDRSRSFFIKKYFICFVFIVNWILNKIVFHNQCFFLCFQVKKNTI